MVWYSVLKLLLQWNNLIIDYQKYNVFMYIHDLTYSSSMFHWDCWCQQQYLFVCLLEKLFSCYLILSALLILYTLFFLLFINNIANDYLFPMVNKLHIYPSVVHYTLDNDFELNANVGQVDTRMLRFSSDPQVLMYWHLLWWL